MSRRKSLLIGAGIGTVLLILAAIAYVVDDRYSHPPAPPVSAREPNGKCPVCRRWSYIPPEAPGEKFFACPHCDHFTEAMIYRAYARQHPTSP